MTEQYIVLCYLHYFKLFESHLCIYNEDFNTWNTEDIINAATLWPKPQAQTHSIVIIVEQAQIIRTR